MRLVISKGQGSLFSALHNPLPDESAAHLCLFQHLIIVLKLG